MAVAFTALLIALAPVAVAATKAVTRASFASNAAKVDGITASRSPRRNQLLALDHNARFPASVFPAGLQGHQGLVGAKGDPGAQGDPGPKGDSGLKGDPGTPGVAVTARIRSTSTVPLSSGATNVTIPVTGNSWTQGASEVDLFAISDTVIQPTGCSGGEGVIVTVGNPGNLTTIFMSPASTGPGLTTASELVTPLLFEPGSDTARSLPTVTASDTCTGSGSVESVSVDVLRAV